MIADAVSVLRSCYAWLMNLEVAGVHVFRIAMAIIALTVALGILRFFIGLRR